MSAKIIPFSTRNTRTESDKYEAALETQARDLDPEAWDLLDSLFSDLEPGESTSRCPFCLSHSCDTDCDAAEEYMKED